MRWCLVALLAGCNSLLGVHDFASTDASSDDVPGDASTHVPCSLITMLANDFAADEGGLWTHDTVPADVKFENASGELHITVPAGRSVLFHAGYYYDLTGGQFSMIATGAPTTGVTSDLQLTAEVAGIGAAFHRDGNMLSFTRTTGGVTTTLGSVMYNQFLYRYLRFRESGDQLFYETSSNGTSYQVLATSDTAGLGFVRVELAIANTSTTESYVQTVDDANGGMPSGAACPIAELADSFDSGSLLKFATQLTTNGGTVMPEAGAIRLRPGTGGGAAGMVASTVYDARDAGFALEVVVTPDPAEEFGLIMGSRGFTAEFWVQQTDVLIEVGQGAAGPSPITSVTYDPVAMRWLRFRTGQDTIAWEVSPDGMTWMELANTSVPSGMDNVSIYMLSVALGATTGSVLVDNAEIP